MERYILVKHEEKTFRVAKFRVNQNEFYWFGPGSKRPIKIFSETSVSKSIEVKKSKMKNTKALECHFSWHKDGERHLRMKDEGKNVFYENVIKGDPILSLKEITPFAVFIPAKLDYYSYKPGYKSKSLTFEVEKRLLK